MDFVVLVCAAVPALKYCLDDPVSCVAALKPDHFRKPAPERQLRDVSANYQEQLSRIGIVALFSYFEAFVLSVLREIIAFHGGAESFLSTARRRAQNTAALLASREIIEAKRKLQVKERKSDRLRYQDQSRYLAAQGFRFPSELLASLGVRALIKYTDGNRGMKAHEIPTVLRAALGCPLNDADEKRIEDIRNLRNEVAHGRGTVITLAEAINAAKDLRRIAVTVDHHVVENLLIIERHI